MFKSEQIVKLSDTDAAGVVFFANYFKLAHSAYEEFMATIDYDLRYVIERGEVLLLIVHAEADYKEPLQLADKFVVNLRVEHIGKTSYALSYAFLDSQQTQVASAKTVHVAVDKASGRPTSLPKKLRISLQTHLS